MSTADLEPLKRLRGWVVPLLIGGVVTVTWLMGDEASRALRFDRVAIEHGELWRLVTGNLVHLGPGHLVLNLVGLVLVTALANEATPPERAVLVWLGAMLGVGLGLLCFAPEIEWYVGLSGALHGLLAWAACDLMARAPTRAYGALLATALVVKVGHELAFGPMAVTLAAAGGPIVVQAHLHGVLGGLLAGSLARGVAQAVRGARV